ncbi:MAG: NAD-dependent epimerase/dehydratase family protein [Ferruginibacter sp.]
MKILLTGASGFVGMIFQQSWKAEHEIFRLGRDQHSEIVCDLSTQVPSVPEIDCVVHAAGKAHVVPKNEKEAQEFFDVNVTGTENLLKALEKSNGLKRFIFISSVSVYGLFEGKLINEQMPMNATDPYGESKIAAEKLVTEWCSARNIPYYILRLPLIVGKGAPGNLGAMVNGIKNGRYLSIGKATANKSMVLASDVAQLISNIEGESGTYNLTDGYHPAFGELENKIAAFYKKKSPLSLPVWVARLIGFTGDILGRFSPINSNKIKKITSTLTFDDTLARIKLNWKPHNVLANWEIE